MRAQGAGKSMSLLAVDKPQGVTTACQRQKLSLVKVPLLEGVPVRNRGRLFVCARPVGQAAMRAGLVCALLRSVIYLTD
jgi:hypothetical protein